MSRHNPKRSASHKPTYHAGLISLIYAGLIIYGSLFPLTQWITPVNWANPITMGLPAHAPKADILVNVLAYVPLGYFMMLWLRSRANVITALILSALVGTAISFNMEVLQSALPSRVPSALDFYTNCAGTLVGAMVEVVLAPNTPIGGYFMAWRNRRFAAGTLPNLLMIALLIWAAWQLAPFVPSLDWGNIKAGLKPLANTMRHPQSFMLPKAVEYGLNIFAIGLILRLILREPLFPLLPALPLAVLLMKVPIVGGALTLEALAGYVAGMAPVLLLRWESLAGVSLLAGISLVGAEILSAWQPGTQNVIAPFNWIPLADQVGTIAGMGDLMETFWPFFTLGLLARLNTPWNRRLAVSWVGGLMIVTLVFLQEWHQLSTRGRFADITDVLVSALGWMAAWTVAILLPRPAADGRYSTPPRLARNRRLAPLGWIAGAAVLLVAAGLSVWNLGSRVQIESDDKGRTMLPSPEHLPPILLPGFNTAHPRLPHPKPDELARLNREAPHWFGEEQRLADGGKGDLHAAILMAYAQPGSQDLNLLFGRLMALKYSYRGNEQAMPIAQAYDWLYHYWTESQRRALQAKLAEGLEFLVRVIRTERLSPYNVFLYNAPLTGLMAASLALYGDSQEGELYMRFTNDLWKNRVLPVWRQIMGSNGGWHEGLEYAGIGIGQAIYTLPNLWRSATGEDLFKTEPGLRGFLDFAVYRTRPDGSHFHWGDGGFYDRIIPDLTALALEYRNRAAYNLRSPGARLRPTGWPWGPLTDDSLLAADATHTLPLSKYFDGLGLVVARSDWGQDATYLSFKAGDNFWSHTHLDQGAFTLYRGGELAIDSGVYGPQYGSDHHMNYAYQSVAHNLVTVTDPDDTRLSTGKLTREIANDGGQRRIGSGWGLDSAPLDLTEWQDKANLYHTGRMLHVEDRDDLVIAVSDVTAAYTNLQSARGEFGHRSRRVERMWRTLVYDRQNDLVVIHDQVTSTRASYVKRWLLHTQVAPNITGNGFELTLPANPARKQFGGRLFGKVILPENARISWIGGPGREFWVDGKNYDENGKLAEFIRNRSQPSEPGLGRIEVRPAIESKKDEFLVVLVPRLYSDQPTPELIALNDDQGKGVQIRGPRREIRFYFPAGQPGLRVISAAHPEGYAVTVDPDPDYDAGWFSRLTRWFQN